MCAQCGRCRQNRIVYVQAVRSDIPLEDVGRHLKEAVADVEDAECKRPFVVARDAVVDIESLDDVRVSTAHGR